MVLVCVSESPGAPEVMETKMPPLRVALKDQMAWQVDCYMRGGIR